MAACELKILSRIEQNTASGYLPGGSAASGFRRLSAFFPRRLSKEEAGSILWKLPARKTNS